SGAHAGDDVRDPVPVHVAGGDPHAAGEIRVVREEARNRVGRPGQRQVRSAPDHGDVGSAAGVGADDHVGVAVAVHVSGRDVAAAGKIRVEGHEVSQRGAVLAAEDDDVRPAAGAGGADDVREAVVVHVADGHAHATGEVWVVGEKPGEE